MDSTNSLPTVAKAISDIAVGRRLADAEREARGRHDLVTAKLRAAIEREVQKSGPLTTEQIRLLSGLLRCKK